VSIELTGDALERFDCAVILTDHDGFDYELIAGHCSNLVDTRNALRGIRSVSGQRTVRLGASATYPAVAA